MSSSPDTHRDRIRIPLSQKVVRGLELDRDLRDDAIIADRTLLAADGEDALHGDERLISMGEMIMERNGGSLRTFAGNLTHENGWWPSFKRQRLQHWEGETQRQAQSEPCLLRFPIGDEWFEWYADIHVDRFDAPDELWEIKKDERQLEDPRYRFKLAGAREICRRIGWRFRLVMAEEIAINRHHRDNVELFASRRFVNIGPQHMRRFEEFALRNGNETTYGELANIIEPTCPARGAAIIQGLTVRRRVEIDLREFLTNRTLVRIH